MITGPVEIYHSRPVSDLGVWDYGDLHLKVYGLLATGKTVSETDLSTARNFIADEVLSRVDQMGDSNGLGFVIIHPGDLGISIAVHWWVQGSVLCQHIYRKEYGSNEPMDTVTRPVVACVWELEIIDQERKLWQETMMRDDQDPAAYLGSRAGAVG